MQKHICTSCYLPINDFQYFFDANDNMLCFDCFMSANPELKYDNDLANAIFNVGAINNIGDILHKINQHKKEV